MAPQRVVPDEGGPAGLTAEGPLGHDLGHVVGAARMGPFPALRGPVLRFGLVPVHLVDVLGQAAGPLGVEAAEVALEGTVFAVDPAVHAQGGRTGAGVATLGTLLGVVGLVQPAVLQEVGPVPALEGAVQALEGVLDADVRLEVGLHGAAHVTVLALERLLPRVHAHVPFQVRADFELGATEPALEGGVPCQHKVSFDKNRQETTIADPPAAHTRKSLIPRQAGGELLTAAPSSPWEKKKRGVGGSSPFPKLKPPPQALGARPPRQHPEDKWRLKTSYLIVPNK